MVLLCSCGASPSAPAVSAGARCAAGVKLEERWGTACACCHDTEFPVAGSVTRSGAVAAVVVRDAVGTELRIPPNEYFNFFRHAKVTPPLRASLVLIDGGQREMKSDAPSGDCNACHEPGGSAGVIGSLAE